MRFSPGREATMWTPCLKFLEKNIAECFHIGWTISYLAHASKLRTTCSTLKSNISLRDDAPNVTPYIKLLEKSLRNTSILGELFPILT